MKDTVVTLAGVLLHSSVQKTARLFLNEHLRKVESRSDKSPSEGRERSEQAARWLSDWSANVLIGRSVVRIRPLPLDSPCLGLGNLALSQPSSFLLVARQLGTNRATVNSSTAQDRFRPSWGSSVRHNLRFPVNIMFKLNSNCTELAKHTHLQN
ncbi:hypothetical protein T265_13263, partial [Opisthorchis viverrini]